MWKCCGNTFPSLEDFRSGPSGPLPQARAPHKRDQLSARVTTPQETRGGIVPNGDVNSKRKLYEQSACFPHGIHSFSTGAKRERVARIFLPREKHVVAARMR